MNFMFNFEYLEIMEKGTVRNQFSDLAVHLSLIPYVPVAQEAPLRLPQEVRCVLECPLHLLGIIGVQ